MTNFHHPTCSRSEVIVRTNKHTDKLTNKQTPLKTSTSLRYATPVGRKQEAIYLILADSFDQPARNMHLNCIVFAGDVVEHETPCSWWADDLQSDSLRSVADSSSGTFRSSRTAERRHRPARLHWPAADWHSPDCRRHPCHPPSRAQPQRCSKRSLLTRNSQVTSPIHKPCANDSPTEVNTSWSV